MVDSAICALMKFSEAPVVVGEALSALSELLDCDTRKHQGGVINNPHPSFSAEGDTDATKTTRRPSVATRFAATPTNDTAVDGTAVAGQGTRTAIASAAAQGPLRRRRRRRKPEGGER
jgi:hypothetical protein